jgi:hypothetical protein
MAGKNNPYDSANRVPIIITGPGINSHGTQVDTLVSLNAVCVMLGGCA